MQHILTQEIIDGFNKILKEEESIVHVRFDGTCGYIEFMPDKYLDDKCTPYANEEFYDTLNTYLKNEYSLPEVSRNNTWSIFWLNG
ncbi:hypothetical protein [Paenibacillus dendritiformis]|uniref:hypothetical protein n=1 Tax=Paenibacillus dendritiformis TaxID=130049 RepID=UPI00387E08D7